MAPPSSPPGVAIRLVTTYADTTRRIDLQLTGERGLVAEGGRVTPFDAADLWPTVRDLLPPLEPLRADPVGRRAAVEPTLPGPGWAEECRAMVALAIVAAPQGLDAEPSAAVLRTWFATEDELWSASQTAVGGTDIRLAATGDLAELLVWDVTGALEALVHELPEPAR